MAMGRIGLSGHERELLLDASRVSDAYHTFEVRRYPGRIHQRFWTEPLDCRMAGVGQCCIVIPHHGFGKGDQEVAVLDATAGCRLVISQGCQVDLSSMILAARTEQV